MQETIRENHGEIDRLEKGLTKSEQNVSKKDMEIKVLSTMREALDSELSIKLGVIEGLEKEVQSYKEITQKLKSSLTEFRESSEKQIVVLQERIQTLEENLFEEEDINRELNHEKVKMEAELSSLRAKEYEEVIRTLQSELERGEAAYRSLEALLKEYQEKQRAHIGRVEELYGKAQVCGKFLVVLNQLIVRAPGRRRTEQRSPRAHCCV